ncbi:MAG: DUF63 family protein [Methanoregulaceae archaeon]|nr:DUF63 family protein [Methanoregulaceae archaeon]
MISEFIYKYYIDPIRYGQPYNVVDTLTYALILVLSVYILYRWLMRSRYLNRIRLTIDTPFILATLPYVVLGGLLRVVQDTGMITGNIQFLLVTPLIYFVLFFFTLGMIFLSRYLQAQGYIKNFLSAYDFAGTMSVVTVALILAAWGITRTQIDLTVLFVIPLMAVAATAILWAFMRYVLSWKYVNHPLYITLLFSHMLDASATSYGIDMHPALQYVEQHVVGSNLIAWTHTAFVMFPLKLVVLFPAIYVLEMYRPEADPDFWHLVLLAMIVVGLAPGIRDMTRMVLYV